MQMYPGASYKEHHYKVEKDDYMYKDDFQFSKVSGPSMHMKRPDHQYMMVDHHRNHGKLGPTMHMMMNPNDHNKHHNYGGHCGPNKHGMNKYSETIYEQEELKQFHGGNNKYDNSSFAGHHNYGKPNYGGHEGGGYTDHHNYGMPSYGRNERYYSGERKNGAAAMWDCKGMDD